MREFLKRKSGSGTGLARSGAMRAKLLREVSVSIRPETEELVAAALETGLGSAPSFYTIEETRETTATVYIQGAEPSIHRLRMKAEQALARLASEGFPAQAGPVRVRRLQREDWANSWKRHFPPIEIGRGLLIKPSWSRRRAKAGQAVIILDPGLSFGTGHHATTRFCLEQLLRFRDRSRRQSFLDIGTGSGLLAIAAAKIGYRPVRAFDFDPEAVRVARENAEMNGVLDRVRPTRRDLATLPLPTGRTYDMVCANLTYDLLLAQSRSIQARVGPAGRLVLSGILVSQFDLVASAYSAAGFPLSIDVGEGEWRSGLFHRAGC
jgi:ribosomal protein L11 methyltransferase